MPLRAFAADALNERDCDFHGVHLLAHPASLRIATVAYGELFPTSHLQRKHKCGAGASNYSTLFWF